MAGQPQYMVSLNQKSYSPYLFIYLMFIYRNGLVVLTLALSISGCAGFSSYQRAEVLERFDSYSIVAITAADRNISTKSQFVNLGMVPEISYRYGLGYNIEIGVKVYITGLYPLPKIDVKYEVMDREVIDFSIDISLADNEKGIIFPLSYKLSDRFEMTVSPFLYEREYVSDIASTQDSHNVSTKTIKDVEIMFGSYLSLWIDLDRIKLVPEIGIYTLTNMIYYSFGLGFVW